MYTNVSKSLEKAIASLYVFGPMYMSVLLYMYFRGPERTPLLFPSLFLLDFLGHVPYDLYASYF